MNEQKLRQQVRKLFYDNISAGYSKYLKKHYFYIMPSAGVYPYQWWWDTCFHIFILCALDELELARRNLESLFALQQEDGFVGHIIFWNRMLPTNKMDVLQAKPTFHTMRPHMSALIQPPFAAQALQKIYEGNRDKTFLKTMLPKLKKYHTWLINNRDFEGDGLLSIITSFESGMDWKPSFDEVVGFQGQANQILYWKIISVDFRNFMHRYNLKTIHKSDYFIVKEVAFNTIYVLDLYTMSYLCDQAGDKDAVFYKKRARKVADRMVDLMYDEKTCAFYDVWGKKKKQSQVLTPTIFFPIVLDDIRRQICDHIVENHLRNRDEFAVQYPIPSVAKNEPSFKQEQTYFLWRGPTWVFYNWFLFKSLISKGYKKDADQLLDTMLRLVHKSGFREYYNSFTGEGYGAEEFTWSGLVIDMLKMSK